ncbi:hypothetical protein [Bradyrhizobium sp. CCBAU 51753]|uniref:hypothetical protein n=1 Tax=Bradyrhizobium sp. CCBAU 51753 TaxID=1325100 RepID=UPI00188A6B46|nr:hypothetical protein [Bradyrhizobium sp. CCBAU 51753]QOZ24199.1 hypothetical protein XH93_11925 [Bradyrhizobium sp. CCBAU 51753]
MAVISCRSTATPTMRRLGLNSYLVPVLLIWAVSATAEENKTDDDRSSPVVPNVGIGCSLKRKTGEVEAETFVAREHFKEDITPTAQVRISWLGATFVRRFAVTVETAGNRCLRTYTLKKPSKDNEIIGELSIPDETKLADIWRLLRRQPNGESGALQSNSAPNILFVRDAMGAPGVVDVLWAGAGWEIGASPIGKQRRWPPGTRVFFH